MRTVLLVTALLVSGVASGQAGTAPGLYSSQDSVAACAALYRFLLPGSLLDNLSVSDRREWERLREKEDILYKHLREVLWPVEDGYHRDTAEHLIRAATKVLSNLALFSTGGLDRVGYERYCDEQYLIPIMQWRLAQ